MRILHLANHAELIGNGIVNMMVDLACLQAQAGHDVVVASSGGGFEPLLDRYGVGHVYLDQSRNPRKVPKMVIGLNRLIRHFDPEVVHAHMMTGAMIARFGTWRRRYALVTTVHNEFQRSASLMAYADRVVGVTQAVTDAMARRGTRPERLSTVRNGTIGTPRFTDVPRGAAPGLKRPSITTVAGMYTRKGITDLIRAFALLRKDFPGASLNLVGDGPDRPVMEALALELELGESVCFAGFIADPGPWLAETDVFVLASHREPAGLVICEAREAGCAIVASDVDGIPEMLDGGEAGLLVPPGSPDQLAHAIGRLLADPALREEYVQRAARNLETFSAPHVAQRYLDIYARAINEFHDAHGGSRRSPADRTSRAAATDRQ
jgi:glycosyltransferase involved in cell wall biosynthesis